MIDHESREALTRWASDLTDRAQALAARLPTNSLPIQVKSDIEHAARWLGTRSVDDRRHTLEIAEKILRMASHRLTSIEEGLDRAGVRVSSSRKRD